MTSITKSQMARFHALADSLLELAPPGLLLKRELKNYVVLERKLGKSTVNKNAVSCLSDGVCFMVPDSALEAEATTEGLEAHQTGRFHRLSFPNLTTSQVDSNRPFFTKLVLAAIRHAEHLQGTKAPMKVRG